MRILEEKSGQMEKRKQRGVRVMNKIEKRRNYECDTRDWGREKKEKQKCFVKEKA